MKFCCEKFVLNIYFELVTMILIIVNCLIYIDGNSYKFLEKYFMFIFLTEMILKLIALDYINYFKTIWNIIDFIVLFLYYFKYIIPEFQLFPNFGAFRIIRIVKVTPIKHFQILIAALRGTSKLVGQALLIFMTFSSVFSIIGRLIFQKILLNRCFLEKIGIVMNDLEKNEEMLCGNQKCPFQYFCGKSIENPDFGLTSFDSFFYAFIQILRIITFDNWTHLMISIQKCYSNYAWIYFGFIVFIGNYFLNNFILAVIKVRFSEVWTELKIEENMNRNNNNNNNIKRYNLLNLKRMFPDLLFGNRRIITKTSLKKKKSLVDNETTSTHKKKSLIKHSKTMKEINLHSFKLEEGTVNYNNYVHRHNTFHNKNVFKQYKKK